MTAKSQKSSILPRPPIVVVMGHVDHGKTSLLDYLRKTNFVAREAGGITQSIGGYEIEVKHGGHENKKITFIDTPGHEAFSRMRARGAAIADFAVLVVAADDGPKPQTKEAIKTLNDTKTPFVVAITKIDKPNADIDRVKDALTAEGVLLEGYGGNVSYQGISVKTGEGVEELLNLILLLGEVEELTCDASKPGRGYIIESHKDNRRGIIANFILKDGTLNEGDELSTLSAHGKVRTLENFLGKRVKSLSPSAPGVIVGFETLPKVGEEFVVGGDKPLPQKPVASQKPVKKVVSKKPHVILKAETSGSLEVLRQVIEPVAEITDASVGDITASDIKNAMNTGSIILGFSTNIDKANQSLAQIYKVQVILSDIIYELIKSLDAHIKGGAGPEALGELEILKVFGNKGKKQVVGCKVMGGVVYNESHVSIFRNDEEIGKGKLANLQSNKKDVDELKSGECGLLIDSETLLQVGDRIKTF